MSPDAATALPDYSMRNAAAAAGLGGTPLGLVTIMVWENFTGHKLDSLSASAIGSVGAGVFSYLWHVSQRLIEKHLNLNL